jgi:hypothetical protein
MQLKTNVILFLAVKENSCGWEEDVSPWLAEVQSKCFLNLF